MNTDDQSDVIAFLMARARQRDRDAERIDTHSAYIYLSGDEAWKLKRAVWYPFMDLSTVDKRGECCVAEVELNRRTAPALYRGVGAITRDADGRLAIDGEGPVVDWFVRMWRFDQAGLFDRLADRGALASEAMATLADTIAAFHQAAKPRPDKGGGGAMRWIVDDNSAEFHEMVGLVDGGQIDALESASLIQLDRIGPLLDARRGAGWVRRCHGDLHLRNVVMIDGRPILFDCIEFSEDIACVDVLYDLAFMLMDLWKRGLRGHANALFNRYLQSSGQHGGVAALPLFLSARATVRAKVLGLQAAAARESDATTALHTDEIAAYLALAVGFANPNRPRMIAVGGLSGSGKTTLAHALAPEVGPAPGAVVLRSDIERKRLFGVDATMRLPESAYAPEVSQRIYRLLMDRAAACLAQGHAVIVDAVFDRQADRAAVAMVGADMGLPFTGFWLDAPEAVLTARVNERRGDASDADAEVVRRQLAGDMGALDWKRLDARGAPGAVADQARASLVEMLA